MRIGIDIDGVLTDLDRFQFDYFSKFCVENKIEYKIKASDYNICKTFGLGKKEEDRFWNDYLKHYAKHEKARPFAAQVLRKLKKRGGDEIYIITARWLTNRDDKLGKEMRKTVKRWLKKNKIVYDKLIFSNAEKEEKVAEIQEHHIDLMIEDSPKNLTQLSAIIPLICYDASYNQHCKNDNIYRCYSWFDIYNTINKINNQKIKDTSKSAK